MSLPVRQGTPVDPGLFEARPVPCQNSATGLDLGVYAARWYSLMRPPETGRRLIRSWERSATDSPGRGRDLHGFDTGGGEDRAGGCGELPGAAANQEPEVRCAAAEADQEVADLLGSPGSVRVGGDPQGPGIVA